MAKKTPIELMLDKVEFKEVPFEKSSNPNMPYVTHEGILQLGDIYIPVYVLNTGQRILDADAIEKLLGIL